MYDNKLIASHWAVAGNHYPGDGTEVADVIYKDRIEIISKVGFQGIGMVELELLNIKDTYGYKEAKRIAEANGITEIEVEVLEDWWEYDNEAAQETRKNIFEAAEQLEARHIKIFGADTGQIEEEKFLKEFEKLCKEAEAIGTKIAIEFMPFKAEMNSIKDVLKAVRKTGVKNAGLCLDTWHTFMGPSTYEDILLCKPEEIVTVELDDGYTNLVSGSLWRDTCDYRLMPGEGDFDCRNFMEKILALGYKGPFGCEVISTELRKMPLKKAAARVYASVKQYL